MTEYKIWKAEELTAHFAGAEARIRELEAAIACMKQTVNDLAGEKHDAEARVKELEAEVDMLRCCENCKNTDVGVDRTPCMLCTRVSVYKTADKPRMTDNWESCYVPTARFTEDKGEL